MIDAMQAALDAHRQEHGRAPGAVITASQYVAIDKMMSNPVGWDRDALLDGVPIIVRPDGTPPPAGWCDLRSVS